MNIQEIINLLARGVRVTGEQYLRDVLAPAHMRGTWSQRWLGTLGAFVELTLQGAKQASDIGFPATCPGDALDYVGGNEDIERLIAEANGTYRDRLRDPFATWHASGTAAGVESQLDGFGLSNCNAYDMAAGWDPGDGNVWSFSRFWVVIDQPHNWSLLVAGEEVIAGEELVAGVDGMTQTDYRNLRRIVLKWRSGHSTPVDFFLIYAGALGSLSQAAADTLIAAEDAVDLPITRPWASDDVYADDKLNAGGYIEPI